MKELPQYVDYFAIKDPRGTFKKPYTTEKFLNYMETIKETYFSTSIAGAFRGLHYQSGEAAQAKLIVCLKGALTDFAVDIRPESEQYGKIFKFDLNENQHSSVFVPRGFAHGFLSNSVCLIANFCDNHYDPEAEKQLHPNYVLKKFNLSANEISEKDQSAPKDLP